MEPVEKLDRHMLLEHEISIKAYSDRVWDFLINIEENYRAWHPGDHILFRWTAGEPFETGAAFYAEQLMGGRKVKYHGRITECIPGEKITMRFSFPLSLITDKIDMIIESHGAETMFKHITYLKFKLLSRTIFKSQNIRMLREMDSHVRTEAENMKQILETVH